MQAVKVSGRVVDINGEPVIGASIQEKETSNGVITDIDGNFSFNVASAKAKAMKVLDMIQEACIKGHIDFQMPEDSEVEV